VKVLINCEKKKKKKRKKEKNKKKKRGKEIGPGLAITLSWAG
jgi:hypothetical protein